jgi:hypothetical protein
VLILVGIVAGAFLGTRFVAGAEETSRNLATFHCADVLGYDAEASKQEACIPVAIGCSDEAREAERLSAKHTTYVDRNADPTHVCLRKRMGVPDPSTAPPPH